MFDRFKKTVITLSTILFFKNILFLILVHYFSTTKKHKFVNSLKLFSLKNIALYTLNHKDIIMKKLILATKLP